MTVLLRESGMTWETSQAFFRQRCLSFWSELDLDDFVDVHNLGVRKEGEAISSDKRSYRSSLGAALDHGDRCEASGGCRQLAGECYRLR